MTEQLARDVVRAEQALAAARDAYERARWSHDETLGDTVTISVTRHEARYLYDLVVPDAYDDDRWPINEFACGVLAKVGAAAYPEEGVS